MAWRISAGFKADKETLFNRFLEQNTVRYQAFNKIWKDMKFWYIFYGRPNTNDMRILTENVFSKSLLTFTPENTFQEQVCSLYMLYSLYFTQLMNPKVKIRIKTNHYRLLETLLEQSTKEQHLDICYVINMLKIHKAFHFVSFTRMHGPVVVDDRDDDDDMEENDMPQDVHKRLQNFMANGLLDQLVMIHEKYVAVKAAQEIPDIRNLNLAPRNVAAEAKCSVSLFQTQHAVDKNRVQAENTESDTDEEDDVYQRRRRIREKTYREKISPYKRSKYNVSEMTDEDFIPSDEDPTKEHVDYIYPERKPSARKPRCKKIPNTVAHSSNRGRPKKCRSPEQLLIENIEEDEDPLPTLSMPAVESEEREQNVEKAAQSSSRVKSMPLKKRATKKQVEKIRKMVATPRVMEEVVEDTPSESQVQDSPIVSPSKPRRPRKVLSQKVPVQLRESRLVVENKSPEAENVLNPVQARKSPKKKPAKKKKVTNSLKETDASSSEEVPEIKKTPRKGQPNASASHEITVTEGITTQVFEKPNTSKASPKKQSLQNNERMKVGTAVCPNKKQKRTPKSVSESALPFGKRDLSDNFKNSANVPECVISPQKTAFKSTSSEDSSIVNLEASISPLLKNVKVCVEKISLVSNSASPSKSTRKVQKNRSLKKKDQIKNCVKKSNIVKDSTQNDTRVSSLNKAIVPESPKLVVTRSPSQRAGSTPKKFESYVT